MVGRISRWPRGEEGAGGGDADSGKVYIYIGNVLILTHSPLTV